MKSKTVILGSLSVILILCMFLLFKGFNRPETYVLADSMEPKQHRFVCLFSGENEIFTEDLRQGVETAMEENDVWVTFQSFSLSDINSHLDAFEMAIEANVDGIITNIPSVKEIGLLIDRAAGEKIPVITIVNDINGSQRKAYIGIDYYDCGQRAARILERYTESSARTVTALPPASENDLESRQKMLGYSDYIAHKSGMLLNKVYMEEPDFTNAYSVFADAFTSQIGYNSVFCMNEASTMAVVQYLKNNEQTDLRVVGIGDSKEIMEALRDGYLDAVLVEDAKYVGSTAVTYLCRYKEGESIPIKINSEIYEVTAENVSNYYSGR